MSPPNERSRSGLVVILARGGSKGVPGKNLVRVDGVPLVARAIRAARSARTIDRVVVSTDDTSIADTARAEGAEVVIRPEHLAGARVKSEEALLHALDSIQGEFDVLAMVQCTSPFIEPEDIDGTASLILSGTADSAFTATRFHGFLWTDQTQPRAVNHDAHKRLRRQDREVEYLETGAVYAMSVSGLLAERHRFFGRVAIFEVPRLRALEIDSHEDLELARLVDRAFGRASPIGPIKALAIDFDGVLTDNRVLVTQDGSEAVFVSRGDGLGIEMLREMGVQMIVLSSEVNPVVGHRCAKLGIPWRQGVVDKASALKTWIDEIGVEARHTAFVGNDMNDLRAMRLVGFSITPADGHPDLRSEATLVLRSFGGRGAVRELASRIQVFETNEDAQGD